MSPSLRPARPGDLPAIATLMNVAYRGVGPEAGWSSECRYIDGDRTSVAHLREELDAKPASVLLVTGEDGSPGMEACVWLEPLSETTWYLGSLTVAPRLQNSGFGRRLLHAAEQWARDRGARTVRMHVVNVRDTLIAWYKRRGYHLTGETSPFPYDDARFGTPLRDDLAFVILEKSIDAPLAPL